MNWYRPPGPSAPPRGSSAPFEGATGAGAALGSRSKPRARLRPGLVAGMGQDRPAAATFSSRRLGLYLIGAGED